MVHKPDGELQPAFWGLSYFLILVQRFWHGGYAFQDMNEPSNFLSGSTDGCEENNLEHPPFLPAVHGGILYYHTICMSGRHFVGRHYNVHNLYGITESISTNMWVPWYLIILEKLSCEKNNCKENFL